MSRHAIHVCRIGRESEPFFFRGKRFVFNDQFGPYACDKHGDPLQTQPSGRTLQAAYEHWKCAALGFESAPAAQPKEG